MKSDIEIAQSVTPIPIEELARKIGIEPEYLECYGRDKAKVSLQLLDKTPQTKSKLILVSAITPTPAGEGKTTTTVGLADALTRLGKKAIVALREPSLGPVFGMKGGAAGGGYAQVIPMEDINLHFTGDFHTITAANNLLAAMIDNHIYQGNKLDIDVRSICWKRCTDMNDRQLRNIVYGLGDKTDELARKDQYQITAASEVMAILCLAASVSDLKERIARIIVAYNHKGEPIFASQLKAEGAMTALLRDAIKPNLVQTLEGTPAFVHGGPFANIAHGCNTLIATRMALQLGDYTVTEAGFGADLGAEKFLDIKCRIASLKPDAVVVVATIRALKHHGRHAEGEGGVLGGGMLGGGMLGGVGLGQGERGESGLGEKEVGELETLRRGLPNLLQHVENITQVFKLPCVVAINRFPKDSIDEIEYLTSICREKGINIALSEVWSKGGEGGTTLAQEVIRLADNPNEFAYSYADELSITEKLEALASRIYRADGVVLTREAQERVAQLTNLGFSRLPICVAKTQYSFSDNPKLSGAPRGFMLTIRDLRVSSGAGFIVAMTSDIMTMPGLPRVPAAENIDVDEFGRISGLF